MTGGGNLSTLALFGDCSAQNRRRVRQGREILAVDEDQRIRIDAEPQTRGTRAVVEHVAEMRRAAGAEDLGAPHPVAAVLPGDDVLGRDGLEEARPAGARVEFGLGGKKRKRAAHAGVDPVAFVVEEQAAESRFGALAARDLVLAGRQLALPFGVGLHDRRALHRPDQLASLVVDADFHDAVTGLGALPHVNPPSLPSLSPLSSTWRSPPL